MNKTIKISAIFTIALSITACGSNAETTSIAPENNITQQEIITDAPTELVTEEETTEETSILETESETAEEISESEIQEIQVSQLYLDFF